MARKQAHAEVVRLLELVQLGLHAACQEGDADAVLLLLKRGANVQVADHTGATPLVVSCRHGHLAAARLCLDHGNEVDRAARDGATALFVAVEAYFIRSRPRRW